MYLEIQNFPETYLIGYSCDQHAIQLSCRADDWQLIAESTYIFKEPTHFDVDPFTFGKTSYGFGSAIRYERVGPDVHFVCPLPSPGKVENRSAAQERALLNTALSLSALFTALNAVMQERENEEVQEPFQFACVDMQIRNQMIYGAPISACLSAEGRRRLKRVLTSNELRGRIIACGYNAALDAFRTIETNAYRRDATECVGVYFSGIREDGWRLTIACLGGSIFVDPQHEDEPDTFGVALNPHNTDSPLQQLTILAAFAACAELLRGL